MASLAPRWQRRKKTNCPLHFRVLNLKDLFMNPAMTGSQEQTMMNNLSTKGKSVSKYCNISKTPRRNSPPPLPLYHGVHPSTYQWFAPGWEGGGGLDNPRELDSVKRTWVGNVTSWTSPGWEIWLSRYLERNLLFTCVKFMTKSIFSLSIEKQYLLKVSFWKYAFYLHVSTRCCTATSFWWNERSKNHA